MATSPDGTRILPSALPQTLTETSGVVWFIGPGGWVYRWIAPAAPVATNGHASQLLWLDPANPQNAKPGMYAVSTNPLTLGQYFKWLGSNKWANVGGNPSPIVVPLPPIFSFPDPLPLKVGVPSPLAPYVNSALPIVWDVVDTPAVSVSADGKITAKVAGNATVSSFIDDGH